MARSIDPGHIEGPVIIPNVMSVRLMWTLANGKKASNVLHGQYDTAPTLSQTYVNDLFQAVKNAFSTTGLSGHMDVRTKLTGVAVRNLAAAPSGSGYSEWQSNTAEAAGTASGGAPLAYQLSFVVSLKTGLAGPKNRGRVYLPGFNNQSDDANGNAESTVKDDAIEFVTAVQAAMDTAGLNLCIAQPARQAYEGATGTNHPARPAGYVLVTSITAVDLIWDTQRRRSRI